MVERQRLLHLYGEELFLEEAYACDRMRQMIRRELQMENEVHEEKVSKDEGLGEMLDYKDSLHRGEIFESAMHNSTARLPIFVYSLLNGAHHAYLHHEGAEAREVFLDKLALVVPNSGRRAMYTRLFKWVVAFTTWLKHEEEEMKDVHSELVQPTSTSPSKRREKKHDTFIPFAHRQNREEIATFMRDKKAKARMTVAQENKEKAKEKGRIQEARNNAPKGLHGSPNSKTNKKDPSSPSSPPSSPPSAQTSPLPAPTTKKTPPVKLNKTTGLAGTQKKTPDN
jgi:hypothetical protein